MDYKGFEDYLAKYTAYSLGDLSKKCVLEIQNEKIENFDFSEYDLNNSFFVDVEFDSCNFKGVYLSGSFFCGSSLRDCILEDNTLRKAEWNAMTFQQTTIKRLDAFRTSFRSNTFQKCVFRDCKIGVKCSFWNSDLVDVFFDNCVFEWAFLEAVRYTKVRFRNCQFIDTELPEGFDVEKASGSEEYCYSSPENID